MVPGSRSIYHYSLLTTLLGDKPSVYLIQSFRLFLLYPFNLAFFRECAWCLRVHEGVCVRVWRNSRTGWSQVSFLSVPPSLYLFFCLLICLFVCLHENEMVARFRSSILCTCLFSFIFLSHLSYLYIYSSHPKNEMAL